MLVELCNLCPSFEGRKRIRFEQIRAHLYTMQKKKTLKTSAKKSTKYVCNVIWTFIFCMCIANEVENSTTEHQSPLS